MKLTFSRNTSSLNDSLRAYWPLGEASGSTRLDVSGNGLYLSDVNTVGSTTGQHGDAALYVAASNTYLTISYSVVLLPADSDLTISTWVKPAQAATLSICNDSNGDMFMRQTAARAAAFFIRGFGNSVTSTELLTTNSWNHVIAWHDSTANILGIMVNGTTPVTAATAGPNNLIENPIYVGARNNVGTEPWDGGIDEFVLWKRVLTAAERTELWNAGAGKFYPF